MPIREQWTWNMERRLAWERGRRQGEREVGIGREKTRKWKRKETEGERERISSSFSKPIADLMPCGNEFHKTRGHRLLHYAWHSPMIHLYCHARNKWRVHNCTPLKPDCTCKIRFIRVSCRQIWIIAKLILCRVSSIRSVLETFFAAIISPRVRLEFEEVQ